jgi:WhiB family redox-sensing transcriptional regulator
MGLLVDTQLTITELTEERRFTNDTTWEDRAACRSVVDAADLFFSEDLGEIAAAKRVCAECPVLAPCLEGALGRREPCGVWGGQLFMNGKMLTVKRRRGRPPKVARPEDQMPVIPVPSHLADQAERLTA